jgi:hypothetical protein
VNAGPHFDEIQSDAQQAGCPAGRPYRTALLPDQRLKRRDYRFAPDVARKPVT